MSRQYLKYVIGAGSAMAFLIGLIGSMGVIEIQRSGGIDPWWKHSWMHFCLWDRDCQSHGNPRRIYAFGWLIDFPRREEVDIFDVFDDDDR